MICGAELSDLLTTSAYIPRAAYVQKHRKCELHACLIGRVPRHFSRRNAKSQIQSLVCTLCNSNITKIIFKLLSCVHCVIKKCAFRIKIQNTHFAIVWKHSVATLRFGETGWRDQHWNGSLHAADSHMMSIKYCVSQKKGNPVCQWDIFITTQFLIKLYASLSRAFSLLSFDTKHMMISQGMTENEQFKLMHVKIDLRRIILLSW